MAQEEREVSLKGVNLQLRVSATGFERLEKIKERTEANSLTEIFREALRLYDAMTEKILEEEVQILLVYKGGKTEELKLS